MQKNDEIRVVSFLDFKEMMKEEYFENCSSSNIDYFKSENEYKNQ